MLYKQTRQTLETLFCQTKSGFHPSTKPSFGFNTLLTFAKKKKKVLQISNRIQVMSFLFRSHSVLMKDRCKLFCRVAGTMAYYQLKDRVVDGTPCGPDTYDICVQGLCRVCNTFYIFRHIHKLKYS